jgi:ABC-type proline/glycine betaine transport system permease subunit
MCIDMANNIAGVFDAKVDYLESTYGNSVLDLQANKIDLAFALNPTPQRALVIDFTHPFYLHGFGMVGKKGFTASDWSDLDKAEVKIAFDIGSVHEIAARRFAPHATLIALPNRDQCILAVQSGRADCVILAVNLGLDIPATVAATLVLSLYTGAFYAEIVRGGVNSIERGQWDAARAIGMRRGQVMRYVILPQALKRMIPPFMNQSIIQLKNTSLVSTIAVADLLYEGQMITAATYRPLEVYTMIAVLYFAVLFPLTLAAQEVERRLARKDASRRGSRYRLLLNWFTRRSNATRAVGIRRSI